MGINFSHCEANWSYIGFHDFRKKLAREIGIELCHMRGFAKSIDQLYGYCCDCDAYHELNKPWNKVKDDIKLFLNHSDCTGYLTSKACGKVFVRIIQLIRKWDNDDYDKTQAVELCNGMIAAYVKEEKLRFE